MATEYLYYLFYSEGDKQIIFYSGRTNDPERRLFEHLSDKGTTQKALHIQKLKSERRVIMMKLCGELTVTNDEETLELNLRGAGHVLYNDKRGDEKQEERLYTLVTVVDLQSAKWKKSAQCKSNEKFAVVGGYSFCLKNNGKQLRCYDGEKWLEATGFTRDVVFEKIVVMLGR